MQSVFAYGRIFSRAVANGIYTVSTGGGGGGQQTSPSSSSTTAAASSTPSSSSSSSSPPPSSSSSSSSSSSDASSSSSTFVVSSSRRPTTTTTSRKKLRFLTAVSGFPKNRTLEKVKPGKFGDDAYFVVKHAKGDVIDKLILAEFFYIPRDKGTVSVPAVAMKTSC
ncbi:uncharacterized protein LOC135198946 [Macrobrachium nipponense]|uniref:uncharacterized protein LOC135198946 n=1 Tax=Macrobrachium nipponense TaxID=159736 RepID=UPI0030C81BE4